MAGINARYARLFFRVRGTFYVNRSLDCSAEELQACEGSWALWAACYLWNSHFCLVDTAMFCASTSWSSLSVSDVTEDQANCRAVSPLCHIQSFRNVRFLLMVDAFLGPKVTRLGRGDARKLNRLDTVFKSVPKTIRNLINTAFPRTVPCFLGGPFCRTTRKWRRWVTRWWLSRRSGPCPDSRRPSWSSRKWTTKMLQPPTNAQHEVRVHFVMSPQMTRIYSHSRKWSVWFRVHFCDGMMACGKRWTEPTSACCFCLGDENASSFFPQED